MAHTGTGYGESSVPVGRLRGDEVSVPLFSNVRSRTTPVNTPVVVGAPRETLTLEDLYSLHGVTWFYKNFFFFFSEQEY